MRWTNDKISKMRKFCETMTKKQAAEAMGVSLYSATRIINKCNISYVIEDDFKGLSRQVETLNYVDKNRCADDEFNQNMKLIKRGSLCNQYMIMGSYEL